MTSSTQLDWVAKHYRHPLLIFVVSDEPEIDDGLGDVLTRLTARHDVMWAMVADMAAVGFGRRRARRLRRRRRPRRAERRRARPTTWSRRTGARNSNGGSSLSEFMTAHGVPHARITGSARIRTGLTAMTGVFARAG